MILRLFAHRERADLYLYPDQTQTRRQSTGGLPRQTMEADPVNFIPFVLWCRDYSTQQS